MQLIEQIYRNRLKMLAAEAGSQRALAERIGKSPAQISQWINGSKDSKTGRPRSMDRNTAREIERLFPKPSGWMDQPIDLNEVIGDTLPGFTAEASQHQSEPPPVATSLRPPEIVLSLGEFLAHVPDTARQEVVDLVRTYAVAPDSGRVGRRLGEVLSQFAPPLPSWRDTAVEVITELSVHGKDLDPATLVSDIDAVHSDRIAQARAKSAQPTKAKA